MSELHPIEPADMPALSYGALATGGWFESATNSVSLGGLGVADSIVRLGVAEGDSSVDATEVAGHVVGSGPDREITGDFRHQYGHAAVTLSEQLARAVLAEDAQGERSAREQLSAELASLRHDFAEWDAGLREPKSDANFEAMGIISDFYELDKPHLPVILTNTPVVTAAASILAVPEGPNAEFDSRPTSKVKRELFSWLTALSDEQLINYFQWSEVRTDAVSDALISQRAEIEQNVRNDFGRLIADGLAPEHAQEALEKSFEHTTIFGVLSSFESGFYQAGGFYDTEAKRLGVRREYHVDEIETYRRELHWVFLHEFLHAYDAANDTGLTYLLSSDEEPLTWVNEAVKEHLAEVGMNGQPHVLDPNERYVDGIYKDIRELLHLVLTSGEFAINLREVMAANFAGHDVTEPTQDREELHSRLRASYHEMFPNLPPGETILHVIAKDINASPKPFASQVIQDWIQQMSEWRDEQSVDEWALAT